MDKFEKPKKYSLKVIPKDKKIITEAKVKKESKEGS